MKFFLNAKGWQMFLVLIGAMFGGRVFGLLIGTLVLMAVYFGWLVSIAVKANQKVEEPLRRPTRVMIIGLIYAAIYLVGSLLFLSGPNEPGKGIPWFIVPMHLLAMAAIIYGLLFTARSLVTVEKNQSVDFFDFSGPFFLLWFFPIGVWFVQPRVNRLLLGNKNA